MSQSPPKGDPRPDGLSTPNSLVIVNTGDGKGKSTAAFGIMIRALARDWRVAVVQFLKSGNWNTGEQRVGTDLGAEWWTIGEGFTWDSTDIAQDQAVAVAAWEHAAALISAGEHRLLILDEITYAMNWGWIDTAAVIEAIQSRPEQVNVVLTGRDAPDTLIDIADTATMMNNIKHGYDSGYRALRGIDY
jgi:cob(I)alamin adenosyltransferase